MVNERELEKAKIKHKQYRDKLEEEKKLDELKKISCKNCKYAETTPAKLFRCEKLKCLVTNKVYKNNQTLNCLYEGYNCCRAELCPTYINKHFNTCNNAYEHVENLRIAERTVDIFNQKKKEK